VPTFANPVIAFVLIAALVALAVAWESVAFPLGLAVLPVVLEAVLGSNPLPKGGTTFLFAAWIGLSIALAAMRRDESVAIRTLTSLPVAMAFLLLALMLLRLGPSPAQPWGSQKLQLYVADNLVFLIGAVFVGTHARARRLFLLVAFAGLSIGALYVVVQLLTGGGSQAITGRFSITAQEYPIFLGRDSATGVLIATYLILAPTARRTQWLAIAALPALLISMLAAGSRGPVVAFVVGFFVLLALTAASGRARRRLGLVVGVLIVAAVLVPLLVPGSAIGRSLSTIIGSASGLSSNGRSSEWAEAFLAFSQHTLIGLGTGGFAKIDPVLQYPHNILLEVGVELGIVGLLAVATMIGSIFSRLVAVWRWATGPERLEASLLISLVLMALVNAFFSGAIQDNRDVWMWGGVGLGMYARLRVHGAVPAPLTLAQRVGAR
jgi:O-antigen ligase